MTRYSLVLSISLGLALAACGEKDDDDADDDADGDGLSASEEEDLGSDPDNADSDGDGLDDGVEAEMGTDPVMADSDGDTYWDSWEDVEGTDPLDEESRIYEGYWPYQPDKDAFESTDWDDFEADEGQFLPRHVMVDQWGQEVDLHDFAGQGKYVMIDVSAIWCGPCNGLASWLTDGRDDYGYDSTWPEIKELVESQSIYWITVLVQDNNGAVPDLDDIEGWYEDYEDPYVPVFADDEEWINIAPAYPSMYLFSPELELLSGPGNINHYKPMDDLADMADDLMAEATGE